MSLAAPDEVLAAGPGIVDAVPVPFGIIDGHDVVQGWNERLAVTTGLNVEELRGERITRRMPALEEMLARLRNGEDPVSLPLERACLQAGAMSQLLLRLKRVPGSDLVAIYIASDGDVFHGYDDIFSFIQSLSSDELLYDQVAERIEERQQKILQSEKLAGIGHLAAGVAHEINNPVGYICSNLNALKDYVSDVMFLVNSLDKLGESASGDPAMVETIERIKQRANVDILRDDLANVVSESIDGVERVKQIVQSLKDFSHIDDNQFSAYNLIDGIEATLKVANNEIKYRADIVREYGESEVIQCLPSQINQVILNLLVNAAQAIKDKGTITLRTGSKDDGIWFEIEDTGAGIDEVHINRLFEPFFTTKPVGQGTGLGLSLSYSIVKKHGGDISVRSRPGNGTTFRVWLPRQQRASMSETDEVTEQ